MNVWTVVRILHSYTNALTSGDASTERACVIPVYKPKYTAPLAVTTRNNILYTNI